LNFQQVNGLIWDFKHKTSWRASETP